MNPIQWLSSVMFIALWGSLSIAGPGSHGVGNGGDVAELQAIKVWTQAKDIVSQCLQRPSFCQIDVEEKHRLQAFIANFEQRGSIEFVGSDDDWEYETRHEIGAPIMINSLKLYVGELPLPFEDIALVVLKALMYQFGASEREAETLALKISEFWDIHTVIKATIVHGQKVVLIAITSQDGLQVFLDLPNQSLELSDMFRKNTPCGGSVSAISAISFAGADESNLRYRGQASGACRSGDMWSSEFQSEIFLDFKTMSVDIQKSIVRYFRAEY